MKKILSFAQGMCFGLGVVACGLAIKLQDQFCFLAVLFAFGAFFLLVEINNNL